MRTKGRRNRFAMMLREKLWRRRIVLDKRRKEKEKIRDRELRRLEHDH